MSSPTTPPAAVPRRRVRHQVRDAASVMAFSAVVSVAGAVGLLLLAAVAPALGAAAAGLTGI